MVNWRSCVNSHPAPAPPLAHKFTADLVGSLTVLECFAVPLDSFGTLSIYFWELRNDFWDSRLVNLCASLLRFRDFFFGFSYFGCYFRRILQRSFRGSRSIFKPFRFFIDEVTRWRARYLQCSRRILKGSFFSKALPIIVDYFVDDFITIFGFRGIFF